MATKDNKKPIKNNATKSQLIGAQAKPVILDKQDKLDIDTKKVLIDNIIEAGLTGGLDVAALEQFTSISNTRDQIYQLIDTMMADSSVSAIVRTYAEDVCEPADNGHIVWCESDDQNISKFVNYLLNVMNVDKNIYGWAYSLIEYGDLYLKLYRESDYEDEIFKKDSVENVYTAQRRLNEALADQKTSELNEAVNLNIHATNDPYSYYVEAVADPGTMFELYKYGRTYGYIETPNDPINYLFADASLAAANGTATGVTGYNHFKMKTDTVNIFQADDYVHACLEDNKSRFPETVDIFINQDDYEAGSNPQAYFVKRGKSLLYDSYKIWREKALLEAATLLNRLTRSSLIRNIQVEVGDMPKAQVKKTLRRVKELFEQKMALRDGTNSSGSMSEYTNPGPIENNIFTATHNGQGAITIGETGGDIDVKNLADLDWWNDKFYASYGIPKQYFGWTDDSTGFNGGSSLSIISSTYSKGVKRVQNALIQMLTDAINLFLINRGCRSYLNNFTLKMKAPLSAEEKDYREDLSNRISAISNLQSLFSDIEDRGRRLAILKNLVSTLHYDEDILQIISEEIEAADEAAKKEAEAAEAENAEGNEGAAAVVGEEELELGDEELPTLDQLTSSLDVPVDKEPLLENIDLLEDDELPTPEELDKSTDFSKNN